MSSTLHILSAAKYMLFSYKTLGVWNDVDIDDRSIIISLFFAVGLAFAPNGYAYGDFYRKGAYF